MIAVHHLTKLYRNDRGVRDLTFTVNEGEVFGYLGPNGAGKTTTIRNLMGFLRPDSGTCSIKGLDCWEESAGIQRTLGYIPGEIAFIDFLGDMRGTKDRSRVSTLLELFQLDPSEKIRKMSKGAKQKLAILTACMHDPPIMVFDEPSSGLDPLMQDVFVKFILEEKKTREDHLYQFSQFRRDKPYLRSGWNYPGRDSGRCPGCPRITREAAQTIYHYPPPRR